MSKKKTEVAFIDLNVEDIDALLAGLRPEGEGVLLNAREPAPRQVARVLADRRDLEATHVIAHRAPGEVRSAGGPLSPENLEEHATDFAANGRALNSGELVRWCCETGYGPRGVTNCGRSGLLVSSGRSVPARAFKRKPTSESCIERSRDGLNDDELMQWHRDIGWGHQDDVFATPLKPPAGESAAIVQHRSRRVSACAIQQFFSPLPCRSDHAGRNAASN